jgi:hypothetical protein
MAMGFQYFIAQDYMDCNTGILTLLMTQIKSRIPVTGYYADGFSCTNFWGEYKPFILQGFK